MKITRIRHEPVKRVGKDIDINANIKKFYEEIKKHKIEDIICIDEISIKSLQIIFRHILVIHGGAKDIKRYPILCINMNEHCIDYFQIGAHIGNSHNDPIYFNNFNNKQLILIEPVPFLYNLLKHNYMHKIENNKIKFLNIAVSNTDGNIELIAPSPNNDFNSYPFFLNQMVSYTDKYIKYYNFSQRFPDFKFEKINVCCKRFNTIIIENNIKSIDYLIIDTEGHDFIILMDIDFNLIKPNKITFENCYIDDNGSKINYNILLNRLYSVGYTLLSETNEDTTVILK